MKKKHKKSYIYENQKCEKMVDKIRKVETMAIQGQIGDVPTKDVVIKSITRVK